MHAIQVLIAATDDLSHPTSRLPPALAPGQQVVWTYRAQRQRHGVYAVAAEVVQVSTLRIRIRIRTASGKTKFRWVHSKHLRARAPDESDYPYPELS
jgi:hypothetical protein